MNNDLSDEEEDMVAPPAVPVAIEESDSDESDSDESDSDESDSDESDSDIDGPYIVNANIAC